MRSVWLVVLALTIMPAGVFAQGRGPDRDHRMELEQRVRHQFFSMINERLALTDDQRNRIRDVLAESAEARADLALESEALRIDLLQAVRDEEATMDRYREILTRFDSVRAREREIERQEMEALAEFLDPKQRALFYFIRMRLNDRIRQMRGGGAPGPGGMGGGPGGPMSGSGPVGPLSLY